MHKQIRVISGEEISKHSDGLFWATHTLGEKLRLIFLPIHSKIILMNRPNVLFIFYINSVLDNIIPRVNVYTAFVLCQAVKKELYMH